VRRDEPDTRIHAQNVVYRILSRRSCELKRSTDIRGDAECIRCDTEPPEGSNLVVAFVRTHEQRVWLSERHVPPGTSVFGWTYCPQPRTQIPRRTFGNDMLMLMLMWFCSTLARGLNVD